MKKPDQFALCTRQKITIQTSRSPMEMNAWRFGDLAAHNRIRERDGKIVRRPVWGVTHLPTGMSFGYSFVNAVAAVTAMLEIARLKNSWAFIADEEGRELAPRIHRIACQYGILDMEPQAIKRIDGAERLNGYEEESPDGGV